MKHADLPGVVTAVSVLMVPGIYTFRLHKILLLTAPGSIITHSAFLVLAIVGWLIAARANFDRAAIALAIALTCPLLHALAFKPSFRLFVRVVGHEPRDVFLQFQSGYAADRVFAFAIYLGFVFGSFALILPFVWNTATH